ncbi:hypothetical protein NC99_17640 [Sunxiuqinia dokdonensis]|uniref:Uncharacterized protein n=1 Tax=Sunxiuqinia dokdonensis TaxID=1409788 RepID=A0A0L8VAB5_9BACT|nr:hypothetical protein NC99_17640 [Sunxiuqinia dokdonensis]
MISFFFWTRFTAKRKPGINQSGLLLTIIFEKKLYLLNGSIANFIP